MNHELLTMNNELRTTNYQLNTSDERQATCDEFALFCSSFADFCAFPQSLHALGRDPDVFFNHSSIILNHLYSVPICLKYLFLMHLCLMPSFLYICREDSTTIESSLQNKLFMQNKANFRKVK